MNPSPRPVQGWGREGRSGEGNLGRSLSAAPPSALSVPTETSARKAGARADGEAAPPPNRPFLCSFCFFKDATELERRRNEELGCHSFQIFLLLLTLILDSTARLPGLCLSLLPRIKLISQ